ncbi:MAG: class I SAM-dependent methyltransferase [Planctomycetota bacterium]
MEDRERWDARYRELDAELGAASRPPARFLELAAGLLPGAGRALDLAGGDGRNALWLAARGLEVTLADVSPVALARAERLAAAGGQRLRTVACDLEREPPPAGPWDVVLCFHYLQRDLFPDIAWALAPGGVLLFCQPTRRNLERHPRPSARFLLEEGELPALIPPVLEVLRLEEGWLEEGRHEARVVARRRDPGS